MGNTATVVMAGAATVLASASLMLPVTRLLRKVGSLDVPNHRSSHVVSTLRGGGLALMPAVLLGAGLADALGVSTDWPVLTCAVVLGALGLLDDAASPPAPVRLAAQVLIASALAVTFGQEAATWWLAIGGLFFVGYVNAFNFMDGINGISGLHALVAGGTYVLAGLMYGQSSIALLGAVTLGAGVGFLPWNVPVARVFLGDSGSYLLGGLIAGTALLALVTGLPILVIVAPLWIYAADTASVLVKRAIGGRPLLQPHREHSYQRLADRLGSHGRTAGTVASFSGVPPLLALLGLGTLPLIVAFVLVSGVYLALPRLGVRPWAT